MPFIIGIMKFALIWVISSLLAATIAKITPVAWKGMKQIGSIFSIRKLKPAK